MTKPQLSPPPNLPTPKPAITVATKKKQFIWEAICTLGRTPQALRLVWHSHPAYCAILLFILLLQGLQPLAQAWLSKLVIDHVTALLFLPLPNSLISNQAGSTVVLPVLFNNSGITSLFSLLLVVGVVSLVGQGLTTTAQFVQTELGEHLTREVNTRILTKTNSFADLTLFEKPEFYDYLQRAQGEAAIRPLSMLGALALMLRNGLSLGAVLGLLLALHPVLVLLIGLLSLPALVIQFRNQRQHWAIRNRQIPEVRRMQYFSSLLTSQTQAKEIRLFGLGDYFLKRYQHLFEQFRAGLHHLRLAHWGWNSFLGLLSTLASVIAYAYLVLLTLNHQLSLGSLTFYLSLVGQFQNSLSILISQAASVYEGNLFVAHLFNFLKLRPTMDMPVTENVTEGSYPNAPPSPSPLPGPIVFRGVKFGYPGREGSADDAAGERLVLQGLNFSINPGETVALVGENGAGKTTIVKLLSRLYDPTAGVIEVGGIDLKAYNLAEWRSQIGVVFQDFGRYHLSVRENIGLGQISELENTSLIQQAASRSGAASLISGLANGLDTPLGRWLVGSGSGSGEEEGAELSGGEWQKIALARAFMRAGSSGTEEMTANTDSAEAASANGTQAKNYAQILILDEPTAALDAQSEHELYQRFSELTRGKTTLLISHRLACVKLADKIILLKQGRVFEQGSHAELMALGGEYARLYHLQSQQYK